MRPALYAWSAVPSTVVAAEAAAHVTEFDSLLTVLVQWGLGAVVGLVAVKMMLVLYRDKEDGTKAYHNQLLELTRDQIGAIRDTKNTLDKVESTLGEHNREFQRFLEELRRITR